MFHFPTFPPHALCVQARVTPHDWCGVPPFGHPRINARLAAPRGLSQPPTSFIGSWCPGIHRVPLTTWPHNHNTPHPHPHPPPVHEPVPGRHRLEDAARSAYTIKMKMLASTVQFSTTNRPPSGTAPARPHPGRTRTQQMHPTDGRYEDPDGPDTRQRPPPPAPTGDKVRSLRTQQRAYHRPHPPPRSPPASAGRTSSG
jgi:hypothetical protein